MISIPIARSSPSGDTPCERVRDTERASDLPWFRSGSGRTKKYTDSDRESYSSTPNTKKIVTIHCIFEANPHEPTKPCRGVFFAAFVLTTATAAAAAEPTLISSEKIWDVGKHNAFTDLIRWHDKFYCTFREADGHVGGDGKLRVLESMDGKKWESVALLSEKGIDLRNSKLSITPNDRLMITAGGSVYEGTKLLGRQPRVAFSKDARQWTATQRVLSEGEWLWRVTWHDGKAYGVSYNADARSTPAAKEAAKTGQVETGPAEWKLKLVVSSDGVKYDLITHLDVPGHPNESTLRFLPDGEMVALVRREGGNTFGWIGHSQAPYKQWIWKETKHRFGGPNFIQLPNGSLWAAGRSYPGGAKPCSRA